VALVLLNASRMIDQPKKAEASQHQTQMEASQQPRVQLELQFKYQGVVGHVSMGLMVDSVFLPHMKFSYSNEKNLTLLATLFCILLYQKQQPSPWT